MWAGRSGSRFSCCVTTHAQHIGSSQHLNPLARFVPAPLSASAATGQNAPSWMLLTLPPFGLGLAHVSGGGQQGAAAGTAAAGEAGWRRVG